MRLHLPAVAAMALVATAATAKAETTAWRGPGWYQVIAAAGGWRLAAGPYRNELACKKAMNSSSAERACVELAEPPAAPR